MGKKGTPHRKWSKEEKGKYPVNFLCRVMGIIVWLAMCLWKRGGCFLTIWPTSVVRLQVFIQGPEKGIIDGLERKASYSPIG